MNRARIVLNNGLGDKLLDLVGFFVLCKYLNYKPNISFNNTGNYAWGNNKYDLRLFHLNDIHLSEDNCPFYVKSFNASSSLCPYKVYEFIKHFIPELTFEQISNDFAESSKKIIKPSEIILSKIPKNIENAYGIHLKKSDKVHNTGDIRHENSINEFEIITNKLLEDVENILLLEEEPTFLIVSEDNSWKEEIRNRILNISKTHDKPIHIIEIEEDTHNQQNYDNYNSVLDMFCLSRCKEILQGVKYSTFSILASLLGTNKMRNYSKYTNTCNVCLIHSWSSAIEINSNKNFDIELHKQITNRVVTIETNIDRVFMDS